MSVWSIKLYEQWLKIRDYCEGDCDLDVLEQKIHGFMNQYNRVDYAVQGGFHELVSKNEV